MGEKQKLEKYLEKKAVEIRSMHAIRRKYQYGTFWGRYNCCWQTDSRATLNSDRGDLLLISVCVEAGDIIIYDLDLLPRETGVFIKDNLVLLAVL